MSAGDTGGNAPSTATPTSQPPPPGQAQPPGLIVDSNILLRLGNPAHPQHATAFNAVQSLLTTQTPLHVTSQTFYEFWAVATRPASARDGLGWTPQQADAEIARFERIFTLLPDTPDVYQQWRHLVTTYGVSGVDSHDARYVAAWRIHRAAYNLAGILTFNAADFTRYTPMPPHGEGIAIIEPATVPTATISP